MRACCIRLCKENYSPVYRFSAVMTESVNPQALQQAVNRTIPRFPVFHMRIRRGVFWFYLESNQSLAHLYGRTSPIPVSPCGLERITVG